VLWQAGRLSRLPSSPPLQSDYVAAAPAVPPVAEEHPPLPSQTPPEHANVPGIAPVSIPAGVPPQRPKASVARNTASLKPHAAPPHATRAEHPRHARKRYAALRPTTARHLVNARDTAGTSTHPYDTERAHGGGAPRPGESVVAFPALQPSWWQHDPDPAPEMARPWDRRTLNDSGA
jgi:hypothetical protein